MGSLPRFFRLPGDYHPFAAFCYTPRMWMDAVDLREFYATPLGVVTQRVLRQNLREMWPDVSGLDMLGVGYTTPYLGLFRPEAARTIAAMPARQGVLHWPPDEPGLTTLVDEGALPFPDYAMDRVLMVHSVECAEQLRHMLREVWRVMSDSGRLLIVAPNRRGIWARLERTPFAHGQPYSQSQLSRLLRDTMFTPIRTRVGLYVPPSRMRLVLGSARAWEEVGRRLFPAFGGVVMIEAAKEIYAGQLAAERGKTRRAFALVPPERGQGRMGRGDLHP